LFLSECRELDKSCLIKELCEVDSGGTISTETDMRGEQQITVNTENPRENVLSVFIVDGAGRGTVFEGCMLQKCSYKFKSILSSGVHTGTVRTDTGRAFTRSFEID